jgi:hypothetical protein
VQFNVVAYNVPSSFEFYAVGPSNGLGGLIDGVSLEPLFCNLVPPCSGDGVVNFADISAVLTAFNSMCPRRPGRKSALRSEPGWRVRGNRWFDEAPVAPLQGARRMFGAASGGAARRLAQPPTIDCQPFRLEVRDH